MTLSSEPCWLGRPLRPDALLEVRYGLLSCMARIASNAAISFPIAGGHAGLACSPPA